MLETASVVCDGIKNSPATVSRAGNIESAQNFLSIKRRKIVHGVGGAMQFVTANALRSVRSAVIGRSTNPRFADGRPIIILPKAMQWFLQALGLCFLPLYASFSACVTVTFGSEIFIPIISGNVKRIRSLLYTSSASIHNVYPAGFNLLYVGIPTLTLHRLFLTLRTVLVCYSLRLDVFGKRSRN